MMRHLHTGPFRLAEREDYLLDHKYFTIHLEWEHSYLPAQYEDRTSSCFWRTVEIVATELGGCCYFHKDEDGDIYMYVNSIPLDTVIGKFDFLMESEYHFPMLGRIIKRQMQDESFKIRAWISFTARFGSDQALQMLTHLS